MEEELTAVEEVCDEVECLRRLEGIMKLDNEWVRDLLHDVPFYLRILDLVVLDNEILLERLHRENALVILLLSHVYFAKRATTHDLEQLKVINRHAFLLRAKELIRLLRIAIQTLIPRRDRAIQIFFGGLGRRRPSGIACIHGRRCHRLPLSSRLHVIRLAPLLHTAAVAHTK